MFTTRAVFTAFLAIGFLVGPGSTQDGRPTNTDKALYVNCFLGLPSDKYSMPAKNLNHLLCDQVTLNSLRLEINEETGIIRLQNMSEDGADAKFIQAITKRGRNNTRFLISITGWNPFMTGHFANGTYRKIMSSTALEKVLSELSNFVHSRNLDGVNCLWDWDRTNLRNNDDLRYLAVLSYKLCARMKQERKLCSVNLQPPTWELPDDQNSTEMYELFLQIINSMDNVTIRPAGIWTPTVLPIDMLLDNNNLTYYHFSVNRVVDFFKQAIANETKLLEKLSLTITYESKTYEIPVGKEPEFGMRNYTQNFDDIEPQTYFQVCQRLKGTIPGEMLQSISFDNGYTFAHSRNFTTGSGVMISHVTEESAVLLVEYARENNFGGVSVWQLGMDDVNGTCSGKYFQITTTIFNTATIGPCTV